MEDSGRYIINIVGVAVSITLNIIIWLCGCIAKG